MTKNPPSDLPDIKLITKMAARLRYDTNYIAAQMDNLRLHKDAAWSAMHKVLDRPASEQHSLMLVALCRVPVADEPQRGEQIREIAQTAYPGDVERGIAEVEHVLREINIDYLINRF